MVLARSSHSGKKQQESPDLSTTWKITFNSRGGRSTKPVNRTSTPEGRWHRCSRRAGWVQLREGLHLPALGGCKSLAAALAIPCLKSEPGFLGMPEHGRLLPLKLWFFSLQRYNFFFLYSIFPLNEMKAEGLLNNMTRGDPNGAATPWAGCKTQRYGCLPPLDTINPGMAPCFGRISCFPAQREIMCVCVWGNPLKGIPGVTLGLKKHPGSGW